MSRVILLICFTLAVVNAQQPCDIHFTSHPISMEVSIGQNVSLLCDLNDTFIHRDFIHYLPNGDKIEIGTNELNDRGYFRLRNNLIGNELFIVDVQPEHAGIYACSSKSDTQCLLFSMNATLTITGPPLISVPDLTVHNVPDPTVYSVETTENLEVSVLITGTNPLPQLFLIDGADSVSITPETHPHFMITFVNGLFALVINDVRRGDAGMYRLNATNVYGSDHLDVEVVTMGPDPPVVDVVDVTLSVYSVRFSVNCSVQADATANSTSFTWTDRNNREVTTDVSRSIQSTLSNSVLTFNSFSKNQTGNYKCSASNSKGSDAKTVRIYGPPDAPISPDITGTGRQRTITWTRPITSSSSEPILFYEIRLYTSGTSEIRDSAVVDVSQSHTQVNHTFRNLNGGTYDVTVAAMSQVGDDVVKGPESQVAKFIVDAEELPVVAIAVGAVAGLAVLVAVGAAIGIFFLCFYYPHRRQLQTQQQSWSREDVKTDGAVQNQYTALTLHPVSELPPSPSFNSPVSSLFSTDIDPKWEFPRENIQLCDVLCEGQFTVLYKGVAKGIREKSIDVSIKSVRDDATEDDIKALMAEMEMLSSIGPHPNIVSMMRVCTVGKPMYLVMEYMCHGDLLGFLRASRGHHGMYTVSPGLVYQPPNINLCPRDLLNIGAKIANGMRYLTDRKLVHRALCAKNVLVGPSMDIKIYNVGSFDMAFESRDYLMKWMAPETLFDQTATTYSDVWSFGVTLWELVTVGGTPYGEIQPEDLYSQLHNGMRMPCPQHCAQEIHELMLQCWQSNPMDRPHFAIIHDKLEELSISKMSLLDLQNYDGFVYSQFEEAPQLSTAF